MSTATSGSSAFSTLARRARDRFLLSGALKQAATRPLDRQQLLREYYDASVDRSSVADQLTDERGAVAAMLLYREALPLLVAAIALAHDPAFPIDGDPLPAGRTAWEVLLDLRQRGLLTALPKKLDRARAALEWSDTLSLDRSPAQALLDRRSLVQSTLRQLRSTVDPRPPLELKGTRFARLASAVVGLALVIFYVVWSLVPHNLALGRPVGVSSVHPGTTAPADGSGLTNGVIEPTYGVATGPGPGWVLIDLQADRKISRVKVFNRRDVLFDAGLPMTLEISPDNVTFSVAQTRTQPFSAANPWVYDAPAGTHFRFLRIRSNSPVALTEVEVY